jgi:hypothetical protein
MEELVKAFRRYERGTELEVARDHHGDGREATLKSIRGMMGAG